jgi:hypothetical protein
MEDRVNAKGRFSVVRALQAEKEADHGKDGHRDRGPAQHGSAAAGRSEAEADRGADSRKQRRKTQRAPQALPALAIHFSSGFWEGRGSSQESLSVSGPPGRHEGDIQVGTPRRGRITAWRRIQPPTKIKSHNRSIHTSLGEYHHTR